MNRSTLYLLINYTLVFFTIYYSLIIHNKSQVNQSMIHGLAVGKRWDQIVDNSLTKGSLPA